VGIDVNLQDEQGAVLDTISDPGGLTVLLIRAAGEAGATCLRFVDLYGDTTFNRLQAEMLIPELEAAIAVASDERVANHGREVMRLAKACREDVHLYLKFVGD
jgi:hypothetical protein